MDAAEDTVQLVIAESERLTQYLTALPPEAWHTPSACDRWEVRDMVAHLAGQAENYAAWIARSLQGDASTPVGLPKAGSATAAFFSEAASQRVITRREQLGDQLLSAFITTNTQLNHRLTSLGPQGWEKPHFFNSLGIAPLRLRPARRLGEKGVSS
jgi:uncharacterized protein (TIGR03083 family)